MTSEELLERYSRGKYDFPWTNVEGQLFDGARLPGLRLMRAKLARSSWKSAELDRLQGLKIDAPGSCFAGASLMGSVLSKANLAGADLRGADLTGADLSGANLENAQLDRATLRGARLDRANLSGATFEASTWEKLSAIDACFDDATIAPDGTAWASWQAAHLQAPEPEDIDELPIDDAAEPLLSADVLADRTDPRRTFTPRVLSLENYKPDIARFSPRGLQRGSPFENVSPQLLGFQTAGYGAAGLLLGLRGVPLFAIAVLALAIVGWRWDRQLTPVAPFLTTVTVLAMLVPLQGLLVVLLFVAIVMSILTLNFTLQYGLLAGLRNALWIACWAMLFLLLMNGFFGVLGGEIEPWLGGLALASGALTLAGSSLWIDLAQRGYSERQALEVCALFGCGSLSVGWFVAAAIG